MDRILTYIIAFAAFAQAVMAFLQYWLYRRTLAIQFRPKIVIHTVKLQAGASWTIEVVITNTGGTSAYIRSGAIRIERSGDEPPVLEFIGEHPYDRFTLRAGDSQSICIGANWKEFVSVMRVLNAEVERKMQQTSWPLVTGTILYADDNGGERRTGFQRRYDPQNKRFVASKDEEYEYSD